MIIHNCPHGGMLENGHPIKKESQYRHPDVTLDELLLRFIQNEFDA